MSRTPTILMLDCIALMENRMLPRQVINATVSPKGSLETLSQREVQQLSAAGSGSTYTLFRQCALAILNTGAHVDNAKTILEAYESFEVRIHQQDRGVRLELLNAPADAFVDGEMIASTREMLFSALRDIVYTESELDSQRIDLSNSQGITDYVFHLLRNARTLRAGVEPKMVVCWGGHSINTEEYKYTKKVGHELGLRSLDICTGCGPGVMKGPMKGATIAPRQATHCRRSLPGPHRAGHHRGRSAEPDRQRAGDPAGHRKTSGSLRACRSRHHHLPGWRGHG